MTDLPPILAALALIVLTVIITRLVDRAFVHSAPREMQRWRDELEKRCIAVIQADLTAAETKAALFEMIGTIPDGFNPAAFLGLQLAAGVQRAVLIEAERRGLVREGSFVNVYGMSVEQATIGSGATMPPPPPAPVETAAEAPPSPPEPDVEFVDGQLVPKGPTA
ncbi:MAG: hypothetical protein KGI71_04920 [Patescibacteria group bacterium]|nr:hypothetical protein [Patescibacteria group bacterium]